MARVKRTVFKNLLVVTTAFGVGVMLCSLGWALWQYLYVRTWFVDSSYRMRVRLLCETDHQVLLEACNELSRQAKGGELKPGKYYVRGAINPEVSRFPGPILALDPSSVYIGETDSGRVMLEMQGGLGHFGVRAYTEDYQTPPVAGFTLGDRELIPRLWYYDDGYIGHPEYDKRIEHLIQEGKAKQEEATADK